MAYNNFKATVWSQHIQRELEKYTVMEEYCNYDFEGEAKKGNRVKILGVARPSIGDYTGGSIGSPEKVADSSVYLDINQAKYFNFLVDDVDKAQASGELMQALLAEAAAGLAEARDSFIASMAVDAGFISPSSKIATAEAAKKAVDDAFVWLWNNSVKISEELCITVSPWFYNLLKDKLTDIYTDNRELIKKGVIGNYNGAIVKLSNNLYSDGTDEYMMIRTKKAIAFAGQISETEAYSPEDLFADAVKGLDTYGAKVVRPKELYVIRAHQ